MKTLAQKAMAHEFFPRTVKKSGEVARMSWKNKFMYEDTIETIIKFSDGSCAYHCAGDGETKCELKEALRWADDDGKLESRAEILNSL